MEETIVFYKRRFHSGIVTIVLIGLCILCYNSIVQTLSVLITKDEPIIDDLGMTMIVGIFTYLLLSGVVVALTNTIKKTPIKTQNENGLIGGLIWGLIWGLLGGLFWGLIGEFQKEEDKEQKEEINQLV
jgi:ABC-type long-subunit fatty acid transport system fused permease/ATPase subunit